MKKILIFFMFMMNLDTAIACCYSCARYDYTLGRYRYCNSYRRSGDIGEGDVVFEGFPYVSTCYRWSCSCGWSGSWVSLCGGYWSQYAWQGRHTVLPNRGGRCWFWQCNAGYLMTTGGRCMTLSEKCNELGLVVRDGQCAPRWCDGWNTGFNSSNHVEVSSGNCNQWRCKAGNGFASIVDHVTCKACAPVQGLRGGCYINDAPASGPTATEGVYVQCNENQYVNKNGNKWECKDVSNTVDATIKSCWKCSDKPDMMKCLQGNGTCE